MAVVFTTIRQSTYTQLGKLLSSGDISEAAMRNYYRTEVKKARNRISKLKNERIVSEYGKQDLPRFMSLKNLTTTAALLHEIADLNRFLNKKTSLESGLKRQKESRLKNLHEMGVDIDEDNYTLWDRFIKWFNLSEYSKKFEYEELVVQDVFDEAVKNEKSTPAEWEKLFKKYADYEDKKSRRRSYR